MLPLLLLLLLQFQNGRLTFNAITGVVLLILFFFFLFFLHALLGKKNFSEECSRLFLEHYMDEKLIFQWRFE